ncbi:MAG: bifunctional biotin--[acetyl-CoA-carboxylase] ligase/biotin operon repressor BirA [Gammaproteobacteria bacterium]|nr:MAG: bifunctional biotin--[acetyl-CoA-carboxylase] ligase/biotin operon repressor BirA [Gammaproteobacteria bacterium]
MDELLKVLADGAYHSGEELGRVLGVSRTAVWKQVQKLADYGLQVDSQKGCGYRLSGGLELLDIPQLQAALKSLKGTVSPRLNLQAVVTSTNELAREAAETGDATGVVFLAEQQTAGRGRRGRQWVSPFGRNLYLSVAWGFDGGVQAMEGLSLAVGVAVKRALAACHIEGLQFKWPNDLLWQQKKLGGILLEVLGDPAGFCQVVIGVGINVNMPKAEGSQIDQDWVDLSRVTNTVVSRNTLAAQLIKEIFALLEDYHRRGFASYRDEWLSHDAFLNQPINLLLMSNTVQGIARGVDQTGALLVETEGELRTFSGGEVSVRSRG